MIIRTLAIQFFNERLNKKSFKGCPNSPLYCCLCYYAEPDKTTHFKDCSKIMCSKWGENKKLGDGSYQVVTGPNAGHLTDKKYPLASNLNTKGQCQMYFGLSRYQLVKRLIRPKLHPGPIRL
ncbi:MAG: hypothetical protein EOM37_01420 [Proteobacteria bacterium]|jgi:hypothetical protein|nr:hypothetical protein [Pseudomonadota bacterium]